MAGRLKQIELRGTGSVQSKPPCPTSFCRNNWAGARYSLPPPSSHNPPTPPHPIPPHPTALVLPLMCAQRSIIFSNEKCLKVLLLSPPVCVCVRTHYQIQLCRYHVITIHSSSFCRQRDPKVTWGLRDTSIEGALAVWNAMCGIFKRI